VAEVKKKHGGIDVLFFNAGVAKWHRQNWRRLVLLSILSAVS
jgi:NAD(P)-dependent dehydrogenase (short-subunit alcohol dehydrogenase family)